MSRSRLPGLLGGAVLIGLLLVAPGCRRTVVWSDRAAPEPGAADATTPLPTCPYCSHYADWESDRCKNPDCKKKYRWYEPDEIP